MSKSKDRTFLSDYSKKDQKWDTHKTASTKIDFFYSSSNSEVHKKYALRVSQCADLLRFKFLDNEKNGETELKLRSAQFCRVRLCPVCQWRRSAFWRARLFQKLPFLLSEHKGLEFIFLTLTVQNCEIEDLSGTLNVMNNAFAKLRKRKDFEVIKGFIRSTEVTKSKDGKAHPHFHCILAVNRNYFKNKTGYISHEKWCELWQDCLKVSYQPVVDVRKIRKKGEGIETKAIVETLKYTTKIEDLIDDKNWFLTLSDQLYKKRFLATGGIFRNMLSEDVSETEMLLLSEEEQQEQEEQELKDSIFFGYHYEFKKYKKVD